MTLLFNAQNLTKSYGTKTLFENLSFSIFSQERIGLIGPNGSGKSTLMKILVGQDDEFDGILSPKKGLKVGYVPQTCEFLAKTPFDILKQEVGEDYIVKTWLSKLGFKGNEPTANLLSGGWKKRLSLALSLIKEPDLLLLDEPTNHLDLEGILWLEKFLLKEVPTYVLISHDRYFLHNMTTRIFEIDSTYPGGIFTINGSYKTFLEKKEDFLKGQLQQERSIASKARREQEWLRASPKARTTKAQSRIDEAHEILQNLSDVKKRNRQKTADIDFAASERETRKLISVNNLSKSIGDRLLFKHLNFLLSPGTRLGLLGANGSGKTTLLKILAEEQLQTSGTLKKADDLKIVYFDQHRNQLPDHLTLREALCPNGDFVNFRGQSIHVNGWCKRFLFSPTILDMPLSRLSGGEKARISIAHLMLQPADVLLLDEPTNDLDIPTLETLEESLLEFPGACVLITHDRCMMDRVCNEIITLTIEADTLIDKPKEKKEEAKFQKAKLTYQEKREYEQIESNILNLEDAVRQLNHQLESNDPQALQFICAEIGIKETQIEQLYLRWEELENKLK